MDGKTAERMGLVEEHFESKEDMDKHIDRVLKGINSSAPDAVAETKRVLNRKIYTPSFLENWKNARTLDRARKTHNGKEGMSAFLEKRSPVWFYDE